MAEKVCPVWMGRLLASPIRRWLHDPVKLLGPFVESGMTVLDAGPGMGFFSVPLARMVGPGGRVVCVDAQEGMLAALVRRAEKAGVADRIDARLVTDAGFALGGLDGAVGFALAFAMVHEVPDARAFFGAVARSMRPGARLLVAEPRRHVSEGAFGKTVDAAIAAGLAAAEPPRVSRCLAALFRRP